MSENPESPGPQSPGPQSPGPQSTAPPPPPPPGMAGPQSPTGLAAPMTAGMPGAGVPQLSSVGKRLGAYLIDAVLFLVTLGIGWIIWTLIILGRGQTPAKQLLHMRTVKADTGGPVGYGMMLVREIPAKFVIGLVAGFTVIGLILYFWLCWDDKNQELWDKIVGTVVVDDPEDRLDPRQLVAA